MLSLRVKWKIEPVSQTLTASPSWASKKINHFPRPIMNYINPSQANGMRFWRGFQDKFITEQFQDKFITLPPSYRCSHGPRSRASVTWNQRIKSPVVFRPDSTSLGMRKPVNSLPILSEASSQAYPWRQICDAVKTTILRSKLPTPVVLLNLWL